MEKNASQMCPLDGEIESLLEALRQRFAKLTDDDCQRRLFHKRLKCLGNFGETPAEYVKPQEPLLPRELELAYAVCSAECGNEAFIVLDGGSQSCDRCGGNLLPVMFGNYKLKKK